MSFTETQIIHRLSSTGVGVGVATQAYILSNEQEDKGLTMKMDNKIGDSIVRPIQIVAGGVKSPVTSQFCGLASSLSGWILRSAMCLQKAHLSTAAFTSNVNETIQKNTIRILTLFLYMSLLVLGVQSVAIVVLFTQSPLPLGIWFLISCISVLGWIFYTTALITEPIYPSSKTNKTVLH